MPSSKPRQAPGRAEWIATLHALENTKAVLGDNKDRDGLSIVAAKLCGNDFSVMPGCLGRGKTLTPVVLVAKAVIVHWEKELRQGLALVCLR